MCAIYYLKPDEKANFINEIDGVEMSEGLLNSKTKTLCSRSRILINTYLAVQMEQASTFGCGLKRRLKDLLNERETGFSFFTNVILNNRKELIGMDRFRHANPKLIQCENGVVF